MIFVSRSIAENTIFVKRSIEKNREFFQSVKRKGKKKTEKKKVANSNIPSRKNSKISITEGIKFRQQVKDKTGETKFMFLRSFNEIRFFFRDHLTKFGEFSAIFD